VRSGALAFVLVAAIMTLGAQPAAPLTREQALQNIKKGDVQGRRMAAVALGDLGTMADVPIMLEALRDEDEGVRAAAESSVWQVWSRSGDPALPNPIRRENNNASESHNRGPDWHRTRRRRL